MQRYQPFDGRHIGLAKPRGTGACRAALAPEGGDIKSRREKPMKTTLAIAALAVAAMAQAAQAQDVAAGEQSFKKCFPCHSIGEGAKNKVGPQLNGIDGRKSGTAPDYNYSDANKNSGITWNEAQFKEYIKDPKAKVRSE